MKKPRRILRGFLIQRALVWSRFALRRVRGTNPHPEELAKQASRRMNNAATHEFAAILRDARKGALLRMRSEI
jgi:hypothetical protein